MAVTYSKCCKCGEPVKLTVPKKLERALHSTPTAECSVCNKKSKWKRCSAWEVK